VSRPAHRDATLLALVWAGGTIGTLIRYLVETAIPPASGGFPWATFMINVTGSFALGLLLEFLARRGPDSGRRRRIRLAVGTGVLGGYTTYSTFAVEVTQLTQGASHLVGPVYALASVVLGPLAAAAGFLVARRAGPTSAIAGDV